MYYHYEPERNIFVKTINIILNGVLISSPTMQSKLGAEFQMTGLTNEINQKSNTVQII